MPNSTPIVTRPDNVNGPNLIQAGRRAASKVSGRGFGRL